MFLTPFFLGCFISTFASHFQLDILYCIKNKIKKKTEETKSLHFNSITHFHFYFTTEYYYVCFYFHSKRTVKMNQHTFITVSHFCCVLCFVLLYFVRILYVYMMTCEAHSTCCTSNHHKIQINK